jgi:glycosyltransferase involved in cell wall biosynthesis
MRTIFLVNPISGRGHLDSYARLYSKALVELGYRVVLIAETDGGTRQFLARNTAARQNLFSFVSFAQAADARPGADERAAPSARNTALHRALSVRREEGMIGIVLRLGRIALSLIPRSLRRSFFGFTRKVLLRFSSFRWARQLLESLLPDAGRISFQTMGRYFPGARIVSQQHLPDLVIYLYLDMMGETPRSVAALDAADSVAWTGILFHPRVARSPEAETETYFKSRTARGGIFLVPPAIDIYAKTLPHLQFTLVPDVADLELAAAPPPIAQAIRSRAAGRKIVLQVGTIAPHKGTTTLLDVIGRADSERFFFVFVGEVHWQSFGADEKRLRAFYAKPPENVLVHDGYLAEERDYNSLIAACDMIYAVYRDFNSSSNSLTKAAGLRRPILVAKDSLMGERVIKSGIGLLATDGDADEILAALESLAASPTDNFGFDRHMDEYSLDRLKLVLADALPGWIEASSG